MVTEIGNVPTSYGSRFGEIMIFGREPVTNPEAAPRFILTNVPVSALSGSKIEGNLKALLFLRSRVISAKAGEK